MKSNSFFLVILFASISIHVQAQFSVGIKGGYTNSWAEYGDLVLPPNAQIDVSGYNLSLMGYKRINTYISIGLEPGLVRRGAACFPQVDWGNGDFFDGDTHFYLTYAELPLMIYGNFPICKGKWELMGKVGYGASFMIDAFRTDVINPETEEIRRQEISFLLSPLNRLDHGLYGSVGIAKPLGPGQLQLTTDVYAGFIDIEPSNTSKNRSVNLSLGYMINL